MNVLRATLWLVAAALLPGAITLTSVRHLNPSVQTGDAWISIFLAVLAGAVGWIVCWTWLRVILRKEESK